ncbi:hypothetical protein [Paracoccus denitrificans]|uniref:hypothetical protein n=1 Tax=Paracoccus denitrificans TaxID=266 RepID=UPI003364BC5E
MSEPDNSILSPTVANVLDEYLAALTSDKDVDDEAAKRLDAVLRSGKVPKPEDIDAALYPPPKGEGS